MSYEPKNLSGALFKNDKEGNENRPDYRGDCSINGVEYQIGAWIKDGKKGKFMSLKFDVKQRKDVSSEVPQQKASQRPAPPDDFDSVPF
jgi:uncharacterized protein (DUF736 family)